MAEYVGTSCGTEGIRPYAFADDAVIPVFAYSYSLDDSEAILQDVVTDTPKWYRAWIAARIRAGEKSCTLRNRLFDKGFRAQPPTMAAVFATWFEGDGFYASDDSDGPTMDQLPADMVEYLDAGDDVHVPDDDALIMERWAANREYGLTQHPSGLAHASRILPAPALEST